MADWPLGGLLWFAAMGVSGSLIGRYLSLVGMKLVGLARSSIVTQTSLVWASLFAVVFAGEQMTWIIAVGTLAIMTGSILLVYEKGEIQKRIPLYYYVVPLGTAILFAMTHLFGKFGLQVIKSASLGMTVGSMMAFFFDAAHFAFLRRGKKTHILGQKRFAGRSVWCMPECHGRFFSSGRPLKQGHRSAYSAQPPVGVAHHFPVLGVF